MALPRVPAVLFLALGFDERRGWRMIKLWTFFMKGGWILLVGAMLLGWLHTELRRAKAQGVAIQMARQAHEQRQSFTTEWARREMQEWATAERLARLAKDSAVNADRRRHLDRVVPAVVQRAESILVALQDSLPELAGVRVAIDSLKVQVSIERDGRILAERARAEADQGKLASDALLEVARLTIEVQAAAIAQLEKVGGKGGGLSTLEAVLLLTTATATTIIVTQVIN